MASKAEKRAAVLGWPISHSLSPRLHQYWLAQYGIEGSYEKIAVEPEMLTEFLRDLPKQGYTGVNLTLPHKEKALAIVDETDAIARRIGAANTVIVRDGKLIGRNTDVYGFMNNLKTQMKPYSPGKALVLGAGGAARAVCAGLLDDGWEVVLANRTRRKGEALMESLRHARVRVIAWEERESALAEYGLLVNTTSLGMKGQEPLEMALDALPRKSWVCDIVYAPLMTKLLLEAKARSNGIVTGLGMLLWQAQPAFEAFFGVKPEVTAALEAHMQEALV